MNLADSGGTKTRRLDIAEPGWVLRPLVKAVAPRVVGKHAGIKRRPRRYAGSAAAERVGEADPFVNQPVHIRGYHMWVAQGAYRVMTLVVGLDDNDIARCIVHDFCLELDVVVN